MNDSYSNPFSGVNAVQLDIDSILDYWCNPFMYDLYSEIKEDDIYSDPMNIVFMGGRSTGKSMFLRYWSYPVQFKNAKKNCEKLSSTIFKNNGIGFYFRIDGPVLRSFQGKGISDDTWSSIFIHYLELIIAREYLEAIYSLHEANELDEEEITNGFLPQALELIGIIEQLDLKELLSDMDRRIKEVDTYRGNVAFFKEDFKPSDRGFQSQMLSFGIAQIMISTITLFANKNIVLLLDEYENFVNYQQVVINTLLRFSKPQIKFRIGMRLEGFRTYHMMADEDFIKEGREYRKVIFEEVINKNRGYHEFLIEICKKRLESIPLLKEKGFTDIEKILSDKEDLEQEAVEVANGAPEKIIAFFFKKLSKSDSEKIRSENPLMQALNCLWVLRGVSVDEVKKSMNDYLNKLKTPEAKKYGRDYVDKYKLSLLILTCSIYRKNKQYYSFNTFSFLSSGIVGHFIELCRRSFAMAGWGDNETLLNNGKISKEHQSKAARDFSIAEKQQISRIETYGGTISKFVDNMGNLFRDFHLDIKMRYPETNQFAINIDSINHEISKEAMKSAIKWSVIQRKPLMQRTAPSENLQDTYTLNRIFSPVFQISYRTRGGKSVRLSDKTLKMFLNDDKIESAQFLIEEKPITKHKLKPGDNLDLFSKK
jgi:hypothetical protein